MDTGWGGSVSHSRDDLKHLGTVPGKNKILLQLILNLEFKIVGGFLQMQLRVPKLS